MARSDTGISLLALLAISTDRGGEEGSKSKFQASSVETVKNTRISLIIPNQ